jgi:hypothetical protein
MTPPDFAPDFAPTSPPGAFGTTSPLAPAPPTGGEVVEHLAPRPRPETENEGRRPPRTGRGGGGGRDAAGVTGPPVCHVCGPKVRRRHWVYSRHSRRHHCPPLEQADCEKRARRRTRSA